MYVCAWDTTQGRVWVGEEFLPIQKGCEWSVAKKNLDTETQHFMKNLDTNVCACVYLRSTDTVTW